MRNTILFLLSSIVLIIGCKDGVKVTGESTDGVTSKEEALEAKAAHPGKGLMERECYMCHNPKASEAHMIAPPMAMIKMHYLDSTTTKEQFTEALVYWLNDPEQESRIPNAVKRFGSMPYIPYPEKVIEQIAHYMYDHELDRPDWFANYLESDGQGAENPLGKYDYATTGNAEKRYANKGLGHALATKAQLGRNLMKAINEKGTQGAVEFCNVKAIPLTDSMSVMQNAVIKRVSDKPRNPKNQANAKELEHINFFKEQIASDNSVEPIVEEQDGEVNFYYPITTNTLCLQCHGNPNEQIEPETLAVLRNLYPKDKAVGYGINELRGIWSINFETDSP
ncbi:Tll0287-like domain-containing protein [Ulvibacterium sp.]|uniref:Tll0287-like domain-containing protein n=1 Tax=Ulvibacterium sp. TaxID=2665914 RepID=UPI003BA88337